MSSQEDYITSDPTKHITEAVPFFTRLGTPEGFSAILIKDVKPEDKVWLMGSSVNEKKETIPKAYGPHTVALPHEGNFQAKLWLRNAKGKLFPIQEEELLIQKNPSL